MFVFLSGRKLEWSSLKDYTLIMPAVSVGNVGQLSVDLLINSLKPTKLAKVDHPVFVPVNGSDPYDENEKDLMTAAELYVSHEKQLVIFQIRSLLIKEYCTDFLNQLTQWMQSCLFAKTVLLSSCHNYERIDSQLVGSPYRYTVTANVRPEVAETFKNLNWTTLEPRRPVCSPHDTEILFYPGGGFTSQLFNLCERMNIALITLLIFCAEGDNMGGVLLVANELNRWLKVISTTAADNETPRWKFPISWKLFFGNPPPMTMY